MLPEKNNDKTNVRKPGLRGNIVKLQRKYLSVLSLPVGNKNNVYNRVINSLVNHLLKVYRKNYFLRPEKKSHISLKINN